MSVYFVMVKKETNNKLYTSFVKLVSSEVTLSAEKINSIWDKPHIKFKVSTHMKEKVFSKVLYPF